MRQLLVINPNMSAHVSALLQRHVQGAAGSHVAVRTATARFGAPYIACEASYAVAAHAALDVWAHEIAQPQTAPDAVLIGCFGDPGLMALRESSPVPVTGLAEITPPLAHAGRDPSELQVTGTLPLVKADDGSLDLDRTMDQVPAFAAAGLTDLRGRFKLPDDRSAAVDEMSRIVAAFRTAAGRTD